MIVAAVEGGGLTATLVALADPWAKLYSHSKVVSAGVTFLLLAPLLFAGGAAFMADRATIRVSRAGAMERSRQLQEIAGTHALVVSGLALSLVSGVAMFLSDVETFLPSIYFWVKMSLVALLLVNGFVMTRVEKRLAVSGDDLVSWARLRTIAILSAVLWLATTLAGVVLKEFA
ncbi:MAG: hypothetical protein ABJA80_03475 [bacterium]